MAGDFSLPEELWEKVFGYLLDFRDWQHFEAVCRLFREIIRKVHWTRVKALEICVDFRPFEDNTVEVTFNGI